MTLIGFDVDGVLVCRGKLTIPPPHHLREGSPHFHVVVSGRTFQEYDGNIRELAHRLPTYIRGSGEYGDRQDAGRFKAMMVEVLGITDFYEDDPLQAEAIMVRNPLCNVVGVGPYFVGWKYDEAP